MKKSDVWVIKEDLARRMTRLSEEVIAHIVNSDKRYLKLEQRVWDMEQKRKQKAKK